MEIIKQENITQLNKEWFQAVTRNDTQCIARFLENGFDIETRNDTQYTALHVAAEHNYTDMANLLLDNKAIIDSKRSYEYTPLLDAAAYGHVEMTLFLLKRGANVHERDDSEWSMLHWIANEDHVALIHALSIQLPAIIPSLITVKRWNGIAPLHMVNSADMAKQLILLGASIDDETSGSGSTPLIEATEQNQLEVVICLVRHGANILHVNHRNETALDIAGEMRYPSIKSFFEDILCKQNNSRRKKTDYIENRTAALQMRDRGVDHYLIEFHASRRMDLFFFTLIAYYNSKLTIDIEQTNRQHGQGSEKTNTAGCHSAILTSLWDTEKQRTSHQYNTRNATGMISYRTGILNGTHFEDSLNLTVELDKSVNYFDSYYIEGRSKTNMKMRACALEILNDVSSGKLDPIQGMNKFLQRFNNHFLTVQEPYINHKEIPTSPKNTRASIFEAQYKGSFFNTCGFKSSNEIPSVIELKDDYIQAQLPLTKQDRVALKETHGFFSIRDKQAIYKKAFLQVKKDIDLPVQYQH